MELPTTLLQEFSNEKTWLIPAISESAKFSQMELTIIKNFKLETIRKKPISEIMVFAGVLMNLSKTFLGHKTIFEDEFQLQNLIVDEIKVRFLNLTPEEILEFCKMGMSGEFDGENEKINTFSPANFVRWGKAYVELKSPVVQKYLIEERKLEKEIEDRNKLTQEQSDQRMKEYTLREIESLRVNPDYKFTDYGNAIFNFLSELGIKFNKETKNIHWKEAIGYYKLNGKKDFPQESRAYENFIKWCDKAAELKQPNYFYTLSISRSKQNCLMDYFKEIIEMEFDLQSLIESLLEEKNLPNENSL